MKKLVSVILIAVLMMTAFVLPANANIIDYFYGDVTKDGKVDVMDATVISRHCARLITLEHIEYALADFNNDDAVSVLDATYIQMYLAKLIKHPRFNEWLEYYVEIEDIVIESYKGTPLLANKSIVFKVLFDEEYNVSDDKDAKYDYTFRGITDETYYKTYPHDISSYPSISWSFPSAGIYEITVKVYNGYWLGSYTYTKRFEVLPEYEFDGMRFVDYSHLGNYWMDYPQPPEGTTDIEYQSVVDCKYMDLKGGYGWSSKSERFVALIHTKEEYDNLFEIDNTEFDDEFFEEKSLVVAVSPGYEWHDYSPIMGLKTKDDVLYVDVAYLNNSPYEGVELPAAPTWYSYVSVDKADVEHIASVQRV
ncbi:MAG: dockerin type I repeat-containing protein [Ruminococcus sp.]|nr:dockerin type I repeat-containing protein [Ruminococcus sp.]